jgi:DNA polymerase III subunit epsilon
VREVVLDTETTGLDPAGGHRTVEVGCVELVNHVPTGLVYQAYVNPERDVPAEAEAVHGLGEAFLADKPVFAEIAPALLDFIAESRLIIHNAEFDLRFLNAELERLGRSVLSAARVIDTLNLARRKYPGAQASLDALCRRFAIDLSGRTLHGALKDAHLLAAVYLELVGGRQPGFVLAAAASGGLGEAAPRPVRRPRPHAPTTEEEDAHRRFLGKLKNPLWTS